MCGQGSSTLWPRSTVTLAWSGEPPVGKARQRRSRWGSRCLPAERRCLLASSSTPSSILLSPPFPHSFPIRLTSQEVMILVSHLCNQNLIILTVDRNLQSKINIRCGGAKIGGALEALSRENRERLKVQAHHFSSRLLFSLFCSGIVA